MSVRKNLLDLEYQTALHHLSTSIILTFTLLAGIFVALLTGQLHGNVFLIVVVTIIPIAFGLLFIDHFLRRMRRTRIRIASLAQVRQ